MSIAEHLIENAIYEWKRNHDFEKFMNSGILLEQCKEVGISIKDLWQMTQYIFDNYTPDIQQEVANKIIADYGYNIYKEDEEWW